MGVTCTVNGRTVRMGHEEYDEMIRKEKGNTMGMTPPGVYVRETVHREFICEKCGYVTLVWGDEHVNWMLQTEKCKQCGNTILVRVPEE